MVQLVQRGIDPWPKNKNCKYLVSWMVVVPASEKITCLQEVRPSTKEITNNKRSKQPIKNNNKSPSQISYLNLQDDMSHDSVCTTKTRGHRAELRVFGLEKFDGTESHMQGTRV